MPEIVPYELSIAAALEGFRGEIEYASDFLDRAHFVRRAAGAKRILHYGPEPPTGSVAVPAALLPDGVRIDEAGIHPVREVLANLENGVACARLLPTDEPARGASLAYDAIGLIFHQLSRLEERDPGERDRYGRFPLRAALAYRQDRLLDPLADRAARDLAIAITGDAAPANRTRYDVLLTHDVDRVRGYHKPHLPLRYALGDLMLRRRPRSAIRRLVVGYFSRLPWSSFTEIMDLSERHGRQSRFYFMGPTRLANDSPYVHTMPKLVRALTDAVADRGHVIGFHPGYATMTDAREWQRQRDGLEAVIGRPVREGRQHTLRYDSMVTPEIWEAAGMEMDCTPAWPEQTGFRSGTCRPYYGYSLRRRRPLKLRQHATAVMDMEYFGGKYRDLTIEQALAEADEAAAVCRRYGGSLVVLYHPGQPLGPQRPWYRALLDGILAT